MSNKVFVTTYQFASSARQTILTASTGLAFVNTSNLTSDPAFSSLFSTDVGFSNIYFTGCQAPIATPSTEFFVTDTAGVNTFIALKILPPSFTPSNSSNVLFQTLTRNIPIVLTPPLTLTASYGVIGQSSNAFSCTIAGSNFSSGYVQPTLPTGLSLSVNTITGVANIVGIPQLARPASNYTYYAFDASQNVMRTDFTIQVVPPSFAYGPSSSTNAVVTLTGCNAAIRLKYKLSNYIQITLDPAPTSYSVTGVLPDNMSLGVVGTTLTLSGTPNRFIDVLGGLRATFIPTLSNRFSNPPLALTFTMDPALDIFPPSSPVTFYSNVPYTFQNPITRVSAQYYPAPDPTYTWSLTPAIPNLLSGQTGRLLTLYGTLTGSNTTLVSVSAASLGASASLTISAIPDSVTVLGPSVYTLSQNVPITNVSYTAVAASTASVPQSFTFTSVPPVSTNRGIVLLPDGRIVGTPLDVASNSYTIRATTPQGVVGTRSVSLNIAPDVVTLLSTGLGSNSNVSSALRMIQGRPLSLDYGSNALKFSGISKSGNPVNSFPIVSGSVGAGLTYEYSGVLSGTPQFTGTISFSVSATVPQQNTFAAGTAYLTSISDQFLRTSPESTDFVIAYGTTSNIPFQGVLFSGTTVSSFSLSGAPVGTSITPSGVLTLSGTSYQQTTPFEVIVTTRVGTIVPIPATFTVNNPAKGTFLSPASPTTLYFSNVGDSFPISTTPGYTYTLTGGAGFTIVGSNLVRTSTPEIYRPVLGIITASSNFVMPVRLATRSMVIDSLPSMNWIEYANVPPMTVATSTWPIETSLAMDPIPANLDWDPIQKTLGGSPRGLTIGDSFTVYATDGVVTAARAFQYSVRTPAFLRGFSSPSAYTNYVRQLAIVNSAYHAINNTAVLPDPLIASETGPYPVDISKDVICRK